MISKFLIIQWLFISLSTLTHVYPNRLINTEMNFSPNSATWWKLKWTPWCFCAKFAWSFIGMNMSVYAVVCPCMLPCDDPASIGIGFSVHPKPHPLTTCKVLSSRYNMEGGMCEGHIKKISQKCCSPCLEKWFLPGSKKAALICTHGHEIKKMVADREPSRHTVTHVNDCV